MRTVRPRHFRWRQSRLRLPALLLLAAGLAAVAPGQHLEHSGAGAPGGAALEVPAPADNPTTPERVALGRLLFWDPILSGQKDVACATCHHPAFGYSDGLDLSIGANGVGRGPARAFPSDHPARPVKRNSQTILNVGFNGLSGAAANAVAALRRCSGTSGCAASRRRRWSRSRRSTRCAAPPRGGTRRVHDRVTSRRQRRVSPAVRARLRRAGPGERTEPGPCAGRLRAHARRGELARSIAT